MGLHACIRTALIVYRMAKNFVGFFRYFCYGEPHKENLPTKNKYVYNNNTKYEIMINFYRDESLLTMNRYLSSGSVLSTLLRAAPR